MHHLAERRINDSPEAAYRWTQSYSTSYLTERQKDSLLTAHELARTALSNLKHSEMMEIFFFFFTLLSFVVKVYHGHSAYSVL